MKALDPPAVVVVVARLRPLPRLPRVPRLGAPLGFAGLFDPRVEVLAALELELGALEGVGLLMAFEVIPGAPGVDSVTGAEMDFLVAVQMGDRGTLSCLLAPHCTPIC